MKLGLITDTHFGARNNNSAFHGYNELIYKDFFDEVDRQGIRNVIHLGDLYDKRTGVNTVSAAKARELFLEPLRQRGISTDIIAGNHDVFYKNTNAINSLQELVEGRYDNIRVWVEPQEITIDGHKILLLPWIPTDDNEHFYNAINTSTAPFLMGHLELMDFEENRGVPAKHGMDAGLFSRFAVVCSGHYHAPSFRSNIRYLGAFTELTWADFDDPRGFSVIDLDTQEVEFIRNKHVMFSTFTYDDETKKDMKHEVDSMNFSGKYVKIFVENKTDNLMFDQIFDRIAGQEPIDIKVVEGAMIKALAADDEEDVAGEDTLTILNNYIDGLNMTISRDKMKTFMRDLYMEAVAVDGVD